MGVTAVLCSFRLVLEAKTSKEMPKSSRLEFLEKFLANNFALSDAEDNISKPLNKDVIADVLLLSASAICQMSAKFLGRDRLFCFISICKFGSFKNPFTTITSLPELRFRRFILLVKTKKVISMSYVSSASS